MQGLIDIPLEKKFHLSGYKTLKKYRMFAWTIIKNSQIYLRKPRNFICRSISASIISFPEFFLSRRASAKVPPYIDFTLLVRLHNLASYRLLGKRLLPLELVLCCILASLLVWESIYGEFLARLPSRSRVESASSNSLELRFCSLMWSEPFNSALGTSAREALAVSERRLRRPRYTADSPPAPAAGGGKNQCNR